MQSRKDHSGLRGNLSETDFLVSSGNSGKQMTSGTENETVCLYAGHDTCQYCLAGMMCSLAKEDIIDH